MVRAVKVDNKTLRAELFNQVEVLDELLRTKLDNSMKVMELSNASFYNRYRNARRNYSDGVRHRQPAPEANTANDSMESPDLTLALKDVMAQPKENGVAVG